MKVPDWPDATAWTAAHEAAFAGLDARTKIGSDAAFEERWPASEIVDAWIDAVFLDAALACTGDRASRFGQVHAEALVVQAKRGFGWGNSVHRDPVRAKAAIAAALVGDADLVVTALGGGPLSRSVSAGRAPASLGGLVRHVATAARHGLGEDACAPALRAWAEKLEPPVLFALGRLAIESAGGHPRAEVPARLAALLAGQGAPAKKRTALALDDPRVSVFERHMQVLADPAARPMLEDTAQYVREGRMLRGWDSHLASFVARAWVFGAEDLIASTLPVLVELDPRSNPHEPSPARPLLAMLGHAADDWETTLRAELRAFHKPKALSTLRRYRWSTAAAAVALAGGDTKLVGKLTGGAAKKIRAGQSFGDDPRAVLQYFALALDAQATRADVEPAFFGLLASRVADDADRARTGGAWGWASLACLAFVYFARLGGAPAVDVPRLLRATLRGEDLRWPS